MIGFDIIKHIFSFFIYVFLQVLVLNNVLFFDFVNPYLYIVFLLTLPTSVSKIQLLFIGFALGLCVDIFASTPGYNAFACVALSFVVPHFQSIFGPREDQNVVIVPSLRSYSFAMFVPYVFTLTLFHHFLFFLVEYGSLSYIFTILLKTIFSAIFTTLLIILLQMFKVNR